MHPFVNFGGERKISVIISPRLSPALAHLLFGSMISVMSSDVCYLTRYFRHHCIRALSANRWNGSLLESSRW